MRAWKYLSHIYRYLKQYEEAFAVIDQALNMNPKDNGIINSQALTLSLLPDFEQAMIAIDEAIKLEPNEIVYKANRGIILARAGRYDEALVDCEEAIKQNSNHESGYYAKACYYALRNDIDQVLDNLKKAIDIEPNTSRSEARWNPDFDGIRDDERFRALVYFNQQLLSKLNKSDNSGLITHTKKIQPTKKNRLST